MFGSHLSIAGGLHEAILTAKKLNLDSVQIFTKNQKTWTNKPLQDETIGLWKSHAKEADFKHTVSHDSYLINLASPNEELRRKSIALFIDELQRCAALGIPYLVTHPGAHVGEGEAAGLKRVIDAMNEIHAAVPVRKVITCLESTAGQGSSLGYRLEHLAEIIEGVKQPSRIGVCLDTAHLFAAGYDFRGRKYAAFRRELEKTIGIERVKVLHLNDSKKPLGSRVDRHEHIGRGEIGLTGFAPIVRDKAFKSIPKILETAKGQDESGREWDAINIETLRTLMD